MQVLGDLIRLPSSNDLPLPWWHRASLGLQSKTWCYIAIVRSQTRLMPYNGLNLTSGVQFGFYAAEARGVRKAAVPVSGAGTPTLDQYWEDGPQLTGWGAVIGKYPDGTPAVVQGQSGDGLVILTGIHAEAPESWRGGMEFTTPASADHDYAVTLIRGP